MDSKRKEGRYTRIHNQLLSLFGSTTDPTARMSTICSLLYHKMELFFWVGFYLLNEGELIVGSYQGPVACMVLAKHTGVCWAGVESAAPVIVPDVRQFPGHIACDSRSKSEIVLPLFDQSNRVVGVLDVDSDHYSSFDEIDRMWLEKIVALVYA